MDIAKLTTDRALENSGAWVEYDEDTKFLIASLRGRKYRDSYQRELEALRKKKRDLTQEEREAMIRKCYSEGILLDWKGVTENGATLICTPETALRVLETCPTIYDFLVVTATNNETFHAQKVEEAKASLGEGSSGS